MVHSVRFSKKRFLLASILLILLGGAWDTAASAQDAKLVVFAAASLKDALDEVNAAYQRQKGQETTTSYAASSTLAKRIEAGAPADIFISADLDWMDYLAKKNLIKPETRANLLSNRLVLIAPVNSALKLAIGPNLPVAQALGNGRLAIADPNAVPAGIYGKAALEALGCGLPSPTNSRRAKVFGLPCLWFRAARHRSGSSIRPMLSPIRASRLSAPFRKIPIRRSFIRVRWWPARPIRKRQAISPISSRP
jgi:ABC-type molybdate transport system substrate-binding protein